MSLSSLIRRSVVVEGLENRTLLSGAPASPSVTLDERVDKQFTAVLGSFTAVVPVNDTATIDWGDGTTSQGKLVTAAVNGLDTVQVLIDGTHTYKAADTYTINVNVFGKGALDPFLHITDEADVTPAVGPGGVTIDERAHQPFTAIVGSFSVAAPATGVVPTTGLSAIIDWGDGTISPGKLIYSGATAGAVNATISVQGAHNYVAAGIDDITVTVIKSGPGLSATSTSPIQLIASIDSQAIVSPAIGPGGVVIFEPANKSFTAVVGSFNATAPAADFSAVIDWGDGTTSVGKVVPGVSAAANAAALDVVGSHDYARGGIYDITVNVFNNVAASPSSAPFVTIDSEAVVVSPIATWGGIGGTGAATLGTSSGDVSASSVVDLGDVSLI